MVREYLEIQNGIQRSAVSAGLGNSLQLSFLALSRFKRCGNDSFVPGQRHPRWGLAPRPAPRRIISTTCRGAGWADGF